MLPLTLRHVLPDDTDRRLFSFHPPAVGACPHATGLGPRKRSFDCAAGGCDCPPFSLRRWAFLARVLRPQISSSALLGRLIPPLGFVCALSRLQPLSSSHRLHSSLPWVGYRALAFFIYTHWGTPYCRPPFATGLSPLHQAVGHLPASSMFVLPWTASHLLVYLFLPCLGSRYVRPADLSMLGAHSSLLTRGPAGWLCLRACPSEMCAAIRPTHHCVALF